MIVMPLRNIGAYNFNIDLDGTVYQFFIKWNSRRSFWSMDILSQNGVELINGIKLVLNFELIRRYRTENTPSGALIIIDTTRQRSGRLEEIGRNDLNNNIKMIYLTESEVNDFIST